jgi:hypothetical protein
MFLTSALVGGEWSVSRPGRFTPGERTPGTHWIGGWVSPIASLDDVEMRKFLTLPGLNSDPSVVQPVAKRYTDCAIPVPQEERDIVKIYFRQFRNNIIDSVIYSDSFGLIMLKINLEEYRKE